MTISYRTNSKLIQEFYRCWVELKRTVPRENICLCFAGLSNLLDNELHLLVKNWKLVTGQTQESTP